MDITAELALDSKCLLAEGPHWDAATRKLHWVDGFGHRVMLFDPASGENRVFRMEQHVGCVVPANDGRVLVLLRDGVHLFDPESENLETVCLVEPELDNNRTNDGKCDASGRLWFGTMSMTANQPDCEFVVSGSLYKLEKGRAIRQLDGVGIANGIAWPADNRTMYFVDSPTRCVFAFTFDLETGAVSDRRTACRIPEGTGVPDGMTIDAEDMIWVAHYGGGRVSRWNPRTGEMLGCVFVPATNVTSCCFGGPDLEDLYITTASLELEPEQRSREPAAGGLFLARPGVRGTPMHRFDVAGARQASDSLSK